MIFAKLNIDLIFQYPVSKDIMSIIIIHTYICFYIYIYT